MARRSHSRRPATSASWRTSTPVRPRRPSASSTTPAAPTRWVRSTRALPSWTGWSRSRSAASRSPRPRPPAEWNGPPHQHHRHARPRRLHGRGRALAARPRRRDRALRLRRRRRAAVRDGLAPGRQVPRPAHRLHQQDGPRRRELRPGRRRPWSTAWARTRCPIQLPIGAEADFLGIIDLVQMKAITYKDDLGTEQEVGDIPERPARRGQGRARAPARGGLPLRRRARRAHPRGGRDPRGQAQGRHPPGHAGHQAHARSCAAAPSRTRASSRCSTRSSTTCPARSTSRPSRASSPSRATTRAVAPRARPTTRRPFAALAFKIMADPYVGKLTYFRVYSGTLAAGSRILNVSTGRTERIGRILEMHANERQERQEVYAGDIAAARGHQAGRHRRHAGRPRRARSSSRPSTSPSPSSRSRSSPRPRSTRRRWRPPWPASPRRTRPSRCAPTRRPARPRSPAWASCTSRSSSTA